MPTCYLSLKKIIVGRSFTPYAEIFSALVASACLKGIQRESVGRLASDTRTRLRPWPSLSPLSASTQHTVFQREESAALDGHLLGRDPRKDWSGKRLELWSCRTTSCLRAVRHRN